MSRCTATAKQTGDRCKRHAVPGRSVCAIHGGKTPRGVASPHTVHGRYSLDLPTRLAARYEAGLRTPDLITLFDDVALIDALLADAMKGIDSGEAGALWAKLAEAWTGLEVANQTEDTAAAQFHLLEIGRLIRRGHGDRMARAETAELLERRRRMVATEAKRLHDADQVVTLAQLLVLATAFVQLVYAHVPDSTQRAAISVGVSALLANNPDWA